MNENSNNTTIVLVDLDVFYQYLGFGLASIITNSILIFIYMRNCHLLKKSSFAFVLAVGDIIEGVALCGAGLTRIVRSGNNSLGLPVSQTYCFGTFVIFFMLGIQLPASMFIMIGMERFAAVYFFNWFYVNWSSKLGWKLSGVCVVFCLISVFIAWLLAFSSTDNKLISNECNIMATVENNYLVYNYLFAVFGGSLATIISCSAIAIFTKRKTRILASAANTSMQQHIKRQLQLTKIVVCSTLVDFVLVVLPCAVLMLITGFKLPMPVNAEAWSLRLISWRSTLTLFVYIFVNREFRLATFRSFGFKCAANAHQVSPLSLFTPKNISSKL